MRLLSLDILHRSSWAMLFVFTATLCQSLAGPHVARGAEQADVVIFGATAGGVAAAVQARRMGKSVILVEPRKHIGGLTTSGLGWTDSGNKAVIGGISREFYQRVKTHYDDLAQWKHGNRDKYPQYREDDDAMWTFEPKVAEAILHKMLREVDVQPLLGRELTRIETKEGRIVSLATDKGDMIRGTIFIDASYEGDLMAAAGVKFHVGREANSVYGETINGIQTGHARSHQFVKSVDPYIEAGNPASGLLPGISPEPGIEFGGDHRVQAYNYRLCITTVKENQIPFAKPEGYDPLHYELLLRNFEAGDLRLPLKIDMMPNLKTDVNNNFAVSTDWIGMNYDYANGDAATRKKFESDLKTYIRGLMWTLAYHPRTPEEIKQKVSPWGWAKDEWVEHDHMPYWPYIREARRMIGPYVQTEHDCRRNRKCEDSIGLGSYNMDSHNCQRYVTPEGFVRNEGDIQVSPGGAYLIAYRAITPKKEECSNLLVPVAMSSSHIAYGSIRMEPVFMILGQSAATAACLSIDQNISPQDLSYADLREQLLKDQQVLDLPAGSVGANGLDPKKLKGIVIDDVDAKKMGDWLPSSSVGGYVGASYLHDNNAEQGQKSITFPAKVNTAGKYEVRLSYSPNQNRATNVEVTIASSGGKSTVVTVNQKQKPTIDDLWTSLGIFEFPADGSGSVTISNRDANGHVIADSVQFLATP
ncbi:MAG: FAD-dependent oxidoreductase [Planctomycetaceae bacterium]